MRTKADDEAAPTKGTSLSTPAAATADPAVPAAAMASRNGDDIQKSATTERKDLSAFETVEKARRLWLQGQDSIDTVERLIRKAIKTKKRLRPTVSTGGGSSSRKKQKLLLELTKSEYKAAGERLALLLCQSGRWEKAKNGLLSIGYRCRLASCVLDYPTTTTTVAAAAAKGDECPESTIPCRVFDDFLTDKEMERLRDVFADPSADYWVNHQYRVEPPSPYFSYIVPLSNGANQQQQLQPRRPAADYGFIGTLMVKCLERLLLSFPALRDATSVEMWAHNRPHASGHQLHFDSDNEGVGGIRNPIMSTILYVTGDAGGPSLVTDQRVSDQQAATKGWLCHPKAGRLVAFDGQVLHGVIPGKGMKTGRRVTVMFAFWKDIQTRESDDPVAARPFPTGTNDASDWARRLREPAAVDDVEGQTKTGRPERPIEIDRVYERLDGTVWTTDMGLPDYDTVFQF